MICLVSWIPWIPIFWTPVDTYGDLNNQNLETQTNTRKRKELTPDKQNILKKYREGTVDLADISSDIVSSPSKSQELTFSV